MGNDPKPGGDTDPGEAPAGLDRRDLPPCRWKLRLTDHHPAPHGERSAVEPLDARNRRRPFVPSVRVAHHLPHPLRGCGNVGRNAEFSHETPGRIAARCRSDSCWASSTWKTATRLRSTRDCHGARRLAPARMRRVLARSRDDRSAADEHASSEVELRRNHRLAQHRLAATVSRVQGWPGGRGLVCESAPAVRRGESRLRGCCS